MMKKILMIAAAFAALTACNKSVLDTANTEAGFGHISLGVEANDEMVVTKGVTSSSSLEGYNIGLFNNSGNAAVWQTLPSGDTAKNGYIEYSAAIDPKNAKIWEVAAGTYTIKVENKTKEEVYPDLTSVGEIRLVGENANIIVTAGKTTDATVTCNPANGKVSFATSKEFNDIFSASSVEVKDKTRTINVASVGKNSTHETATQIFFEADTITWTLKATNLDNVQKTYTGNITIVANQYKQVTFTTTTSTDGQINLNIVVNGEITETIVVTEKIDPFQPAA